MLFSDEDSRMPSSKNCEHLKIFSFLCHDSSSICRLCRLATTENVTNIRSSSTDFPRTSISTTDLTASKEANNGALDPREYQIELFEKAKAQNTIAVLDTGTEL